MLYFCFICMIYCLIHLWVRINAVEGNSITTNIVYSWSRPSREQGGEGRQTGYVVVLWAGSRKGNSPERPAWEWVSISDSVSRAPTLSLSLSLSIPSFSPLPSSSPLFTAAFLFYLPLYSSPSLPLCTSPLGEGWRSLFSGAFPKLFSLTFLRYFAVKKIFGHISP